MLFYLAGMEPYYLKCIKDGPFQPKTAEGDAKPESQWTSDERRVVVQDQHLKSIIMSCLPDDVIKSAISCVSAKETWTDLVHSFKVNNYSSVSKGFQLKFTPKLIQSSSNSNNQADLKFQKHYKAEYKKMKVKLALLEASPSSSQNPKTFQPKNKGLVAETFNWDEEEVSDEEEVTQVKVLMALTDDELTVGKSHVRNGKWVDITMRKVNTLLSMDEDADWQNYLKYINIDLKFVEEQRLNLLSKYNKMVFELNECGDELLILKQAKLDAVTFHIQNTELIKLNHALQEQLKEEKKINEKWLTSSKKVSQCISEQIPHQKKKVIDSELLTESSSKKNENENLFVPTSMGYDQEMVPKTKDWGGITKLRGNAIDLSTSLSKRETRLRHHETHKALKHKNSSNKSVSGTVTVSESKQTTPSVPTKVKDTEQESKLNELTKLVQMLIDEKVNSDQKTQESNSKIQKTEPKPIQKPQLKCELCHYTNHSTDDCFRILYCMICKREDHRTSDHEIYIASLKRSENYKAQPYQYASSSKQILRAKEKPFPPCTHCGFNDHIPDDCRIYPECEICRSYDHSTSGHNHVIQIRGGVLAESSQSNKSSIRIKCNTCGSTVHSTSNHNECRSTSKRGCRNSMLSREPIWYLDSGCSRSMTGVKSYLHKYVEQPGPKCLHLLHMDLFGPVSPMFINHEKYTIVIVDEYSRERIPDISYFHVFGCPMFIHNHKDHLGKFDAKTDDRYFLGYSFVLKAFRVYNTRRQQIEETYHVTFDESIEAIRFTNTSVDEIGIDDSSRYHLDEFQEDDPSRQYQVDSDVSYYIIPHGCSLTKITQENHIPEAVAPNEPELLHTKDTKGSIIESLVPDVTQSHITNQASTSSHPIPQDRWSRDQHIELVNIIGDPGEGMLTRSMAAKLTAALASECLFADFLSEIEPKKISEALKHLGWIDAMQKN
ncbi:hypothetical protein Tco_0752623 [Tanacetum coccineum]|uniref:Retroviral polymerase SH3-like domain-containing protein n=1 Tax=Tanacetum coccineum TaxID=301880 RepID=A0ABQ4ZAQ5_9ASTR